MDLLVRYWDKKRQGVEIKILGCKIYWTCNCKRHQNFMKARAKVHNAILIQISIDGPRVNLKFMEPVNSNREEN